MKKVISHLIIKTILGSWILILLSSIVIAQEDLGEFKFIPPYYPDGDAEFINIPTPQVVHVPKIIYPDDPKLQGREARVLVKVLVDRKGIVRDVQILKSPDEAFDEYAIKYAKQYKFRWEEGWPQGLKNKKNVWIAIAIGFKPQSKSNSLKDGNDTRISSERRSEIIFRTLNNAGMKFKKAQEKIFTHIREGEHTEATDICNTFVKEISDLRRSTDNITNLGKDDLRYLDKSLKRMQNDMEQLLSDIPFLQVNVDSIIYR
jgi:TonB family protein